MPRDATIHSFSPVHVEKDRFRSRERPGFGRQGGTPRLHGLGPSGPKAGGQDEPSLLRSHRAGAAKPRLWTNANKVLSSHFDVDVLSTHFCALRRCHSVRDPRKTAAQHFLPTRRGARRPLPRRLRLRAVGDMLPAQATVLEARTGEPPCGVTAQTALIKCNFQRELRGSQGRGFEHRST